MKINGIIWLRNVIDKLLWKHNVTTDEVEEVFSCSPRHRFLKKATSKEKTFIWLWGELKQAGT